MSEDLNVRTREGTVRGSRDETGVLRFQGLPFAAPPVGPLRFRPPAPVAPWTDVRDATAPGPVAPQDRPATSTSPMDEDCLYLNVTTPAADAGRRPVLFYIHAGAFVTGAGSAEAYSGVHLARDHDVVVVSVNYRLGLLGFPPMAVHGAGTPQNLGLLDQVAALEWVRNNIAAFGGNPDCVTICGYSAGGWSTAALMAMPEARGLFHRAAPQSGGFMYAMSAAGQARHAGAVARAMGDPAPDPARLMAAPVDELLRVQAEVISVWQAATAEEQVVELDFPFTPLADGVVLHEHPLTSLGRGKGADVPVLVGSTENELGAAPFRMALPWLKETYTRRSLSAAIRSLGGDAESAWQAYAAAWPGADEQHLAGRIRSDWMYRIPAIRFAEAQAARSGRAWMYRFDLPAVSPEVGGVSTHATDVTFWFGSMAQSPYQMFFFGRACTPEEEALSRRMQADLAAFCRDGVCTWPAYDLARRATMIYDLEGGVADDPAGAERRLWDGVV
ncbi:MAG: carboxylesterase/lipase family protein [Proteobacteria bacterium]|nr:carboxylesterase/lipase family protein [Pseudomonadota bacterium]